MPPKSANRALRALAEQAAPGPMADRLEGACDRVMTEAITALAAEMGGYGARSKALRYLIQEGAKSVMAQRAARA